MVFGTSDHYALYHSSRIGNRIVLMAELEVAKLYIVRAF